MKIKIFTFLLILPLLSHANDYTLFGLDVVKGYATISGTLKQSEPKIKCWQDPRSSECSGMFRKHGTLENIQALFWPNFSKKYPVSVAKSADKVNKGKVIWLVLNLKKEIKGVSLYKALEKKFKNPADIGLKESKGGQPQINFGEGKLELSGKNSRACGESIFHPKCFINSIRYENFGLHDKYVGFDKVAKKAWRKVQESKNQTSDAGGI